MEPPAGGDPDTLKDAKLAVFRAMADAKPSPLRPRPVRRLSRIDGVAPDSQTETYAALRLEVENWRWAGVPFFIRTGKRLPATQTELRLVFKRRPRAAIHRRPRAPPAEPVRPQDRPETGVRFDLSTPTGPIRTARAPIQLDMEFAQEGGEDPTPYEVLLHAALIGDRTHFTRQDMVEETWRIIQPLLDSPPPVHEYQPGTWGPEASEQADGQLRRLARALAGRLRRP